MCEHVNKKARGKSCKKCEKKFKHTVSEIHTLAQELKEAIKDKSVMLKFLGHNELIHHLNKAHLSARAACLRGIRYNDNNKE